MKLDKLAKKLAKDKQVLQAKEEGAKGGDDTSIIFR